MTFFKQTKTGCIDGFEFPVMEMREWWYVNRDGSTGRYFAPVGDAHDEWWTVERVFRFLDTYGFGFNSEEEAINWFRGTQHA